MKLSIITNVYNRSDVPVYDELDEKVYHCNLLDNQIKTIIETFKNDDIEYILVDWSDDYQLEKVLVSLKRFDNENISYKHIVMNESWRKECIAIGKNIGIDNAKNDYILFIDPDMMILEEGQKQFREEVEKIIKEDFPSLSLHCRYSINARNTYFYDTFAKNANGTMLIKKENMFTMKFQEKASCRHQEDNLVVQMLELINSIKHVNVEGLIHQYHPRAINK